MGRIRREANQPLDLAADRLQGRRHHPLAAGEPHQPGEQGADQQALAQAGELGLRDGGGHRHGDVALQGGGSAVCPPGDHRPPVGQAVGKGQPLALAAHLRRRDRRSRGKKIAPALEFTHLVVEPADGQLRIARRLACLQGALGLLPQPGGHIRALQFIVLVVQKWQLGGGGGGELLHLRALQCPAGAAHLAIHPQREDQQQRRDQDPVAPGQGTADVAQVRLHGRDGGGSPRRRPFPPDRAGLRRPRAWPVGF